MNAEPVSTAIAAAGESGAMAPDPAAAPVRWGGLAPAQTLVWAAILLLTVAALDLALGWTIDVHLGTPLWLALACVLAAGAGFDALWSWPRHLSEVSRDVGNPLAQGVASTVVLEYANHSPDPMRVEFFDLAPATFTAVGQPVGLVIPARRRGQASYRLTPSVRGEFLFPGVDLRVASRLGLWLFKGHADCADRVRVYPDVGWMRRYLELASDRRVAQLGVKMAPRRGDGLEFHQLREFRTGDALRQIDWRATARQTRLIVREYQEERDQHLLFLLDTGRSMRSRDGAMSHFDHALRAVLLLSHVAMRQGDAVGLLSFGQSRRWAPMKKGDGAARALLSTVYDLDCGPSASDYVAAATDLLGRQRKRSLVVLITTFQDENEDLLLALSLLRRRHLVLVAALTERALNAASEGINTFDDALGASAAALLRQRRKLLAEQIQAQGHTLVQCEPDALPIALVNGYWRVKRSGRL